MNIKNMTKSALKKELNKIRTQLYKLEDADRLKANKKLVGKCYKYRNSYGSQYKSWWLYVKVVGVDKGSYDLTVFRFEIDCNNRIEISEKDAFTRLDSYIEIPESEFTEAWNNLLIKVNGFQL